MSDLFPDLGESVYENWDFKQAEVLMAFLNQRMLAHLEARRSFGRYPQRQGPIHGLAAHGPYRSAPSDLGPPRSPAQRRDPLPLEPRGVNGPLQWMRAGCSRAERLRDPAHGSYGP